MQVNSYDAANSEPNFWLSCMIIDKGAMCKQVRSGSEALYIHEAGCADVGADIFARGLCLPSDNKMTPEQQDAIIQTIRDCFK